MVNSSLSVRRLATGRRRSDWLKRKLEKMKELVQSAARGVLKVGEVVYRNGKALVVVGFTAAGAVICSAQTDATVIATNAQTAFGVIAPVHHFSVPRRARE